MASRSVSKFIRGRNQQTGDGKQKEMKTAVSVCPLCKGEIVESIDSFNSTFALGIEGKHEIRAMVIIFTHMCFFRFRVGTKARRVIIAAVSFLLWLAERPLFEPYILYL